MFIIMEEFMKVQIIKNGPYLVDASIPLFEERIIEKDGAMVFERIKQYDTSSYVQDGHYVLCRCGESDNAPFCDYTHTKIRFDGHETAGHSTYAQRAELVDEGPEIALYDDNRCAYARVCHRQDGDTWTLTDHSINPKYKKEAMEGAKLCPTGRLTMIDRNNKAIEENWEPHIAVVQDPQENVSAGLFLRGGIEVVDENGKSYEVRNRAALCRCGQSYLKPFCDANHVSANYNDGQSE